MPKYNSYINFSIASASHAVVLHYLHTKISMTSFSCDLLNTCHLLYTCAHIRYLWLCYDFVVPLYQV